MPAIRLVIITPRFWPAVGGTERFLANLAAELAARGSEVTILTTRWDASWPAEIVYREATVVRLPRTEHGFFGARRAMRNLSLHLRANAGRYDLVYVLGLRHEAYAALGTVGSHTPVVLRTANSGRSGDCLWQLDTVFGRRVKRRALKAAALIGPTEISYRELIAAGYPRQRVHHVPDGVPLPPRVDAHGKAAARQALESVNSLLHCPPGVPVAVYTGRLNDSAGPIAAIAAWRRVVARWRSARLWLIGPEANQPALNRRIEQADLVGRVVIPGVFADVEELFAAVDAVIVPEGESPLLMLEAMASCLPVVAADTPENRHVAAASGSAWFVPHEDPQPLGEALVELFDRPDLAAQLGRAGRRRIEEAYPIDRAVEEHLRLFDRLTSERRSSNRS